MENYTLVFPEQPSKSSSAEAVNEARLEASNFCSEMETLRVKNVSEIAKTIEATLRAKLREIYPDALVEGRKEAKQIVNFLVIEFKRRAQEPATYRQAHRYVESWQGSPPESLQQIEDYFIGTHVKLLAHLHEVQEHYGEKVVVSTDTTKKDMLQQSSRS
jgi:hypothetical protein